MIERSLILGAAMGLVYLGLAWVWHRSVHG